TPTTCARSVRSSRGSSAASPTHIRCRQRVRNAPALRRRPTLGAEFSASVADPARLNQATVAASRPGRPWLRLVRSSNDELGPVSPELALIDPPLAATVRLTPDALVASAPAPTATGAS